MRIDRNRSRLTYRRRRRSGCLSLAVLVGLIVGFGALSWGRIGQWLNLATSRQTTADLQTAEQAFLRGDLDTAIDVTRAILAEQPDHINALTLLAQALIYRSYSDYEGAIDRQSALDLTTGAVERLPNNDDLLAMHAYVLQVNGQPVEAARVARPILDRDPEHTLARVALALSYGGVGSLDTALRENQIAAASTRNNARWWLETQRALAISYGDLGRYQDAIHILEAAINANSRLIPLYFERALYALQIGDSDAATVAYYQVLTLDPDNVKARLRLCELSSLLRERETAIRYCQEVTELAPSWADGWYQLGREFFVQGDFPAAQEHLHRCASLQVMQEVPLDQRRFECWYLQGQAAEIVGDCASLVTTYNEFRTMAAAADLDQTWTYPPEGPPGCVTPAPGD